MGDMDTAKVDKAVRSITGVETESVDRMSVFRFLVVNSGERKVGRSPIFGECTVFTERVRFDLRTKHLGGIMVQSL